MIKHLEWFFYASVLLNLLLIVLFISKMWRARASRRWRERRMGMDLSLEEIIAQLPGNIYWKNREGVLIGGNKTHSRAFSKKDDLKGVTSYDLFPKALADHIKAVD